MSEFGPSDMYLGHDPSAASIALTAGEGQPLDDVLTLHAEVLQLRADRQTWQELALTDELTHLLNRRGLRAWGESSYDSSRTYSIIAIDIADFGKFNNEFGQDVGDTGLSVLGDVMPNVVRTEDSDHDERRAVQTNDAAAVRLGGDEFILVVDLDHLPEEELEPVVQLIEERLVTQYQQAGEAVLPRVPRLRMGHVYNKHGEAFETFFNRANASINKIKAQQKADEARALMEELWAQGGGSFI